MEKREDELRKELQLLQRKLQEPNIFASKLYPVLAKRQSELLKILDLFDQKESLANQILEAKKLSQNNDAELSQLALAELESLDKKSESIEHQLSTMLIKKDPNDERNCVIEIRAAAGGDEASLFAGDLHRMYARWCELHGFKTELLNQSPNEVGGYKEIIFMVIGTGAYGNFKFEAGVHRVQRIPVTESSGRIHTSTVTVAVLPEAEETDLEIRPEDIRVDVFRSSGHGGQSVNTTDSAVRITHLPSGLVVSMQDEKSQIKNKDKALNILRSRLLQKKIEEEQQELTDARRKLIGSGERSEKIRTYNFPQDRITDHRIGYSRSNLTGALDGNIDDLFEKLHEQESHLIEDEG